MQLIGPIKRNLDRWMPDTVLIPPARKTLLDQIATYIKSKPAATPARLIFICTHNSRRSHLSQVWASVAALYCGVSEMVECYSGGTEATSFNINAIKALQHAGFEAVIPAGENPEVELHYCTDGKPMLCFSKVYNHPANPDREFAAIMTCSEADENCPFIPGAELRIPLRYEDPKSSDGTPDQEKIYRERSRQIATEMLYLFSTLKQKMI